MSSASDIACLNAIARLYPGVSPTQADAQVRAISERIAKEDPQNGEQWRGSVRPLADRVIPKAARASAGAMFGAVGFVLLIACANVASLQLARGTQRHRELALRAALGASRGTLVRLQLVESLLVSLLAGAVGVLTSYWTVPLLKRIAPPEMLPGLMRIMPRAAGPAGGPPDPGPPGAGPPGPPTRTAPRPPGAGGAPAGGTPGVSGVWSADGFIFEPFLARTRL